MEGPRVLRAGVPFASSWKERFNVDFNRWWAHSQCAFGLHSTVLERDIGSAAQSSGQPNGPWTDL